MCTSIIKEVVCATVLYVVVLGIILYNLVRVFNIYDFIYCLILSNAYFKYLLLKKKQRDYIKL